MVNSSDSTSLLWNTPPLVPVANLTTVQCTVCIGQSAPSPHLDKIPPNCLRFLPFIRQLDSKTKSSNFQMFQSWQIMIILFQTIFKVLARSHRDQIDDDQNGIQLFAAGSHDCPFPLPATKSSKLSLARSTKKSNTFFKDLEEEEKEGSSLQRKGLQLALWKYCGRN